MTLKADGDTISHLAFSPDGKTLASALGDGTIKLWEPATGKLKATLRGHLGKVFTVAFSPDGKILASCGHDRSVRFWEPSTGRLEATLKPEHKDRVLSVAFSPDGTMLASAGDDHEHHSLGRRDEDAQREPLRTAIPTTSATCSSPRTGATLVSAADDGMIKLWDPATRRLKTTLQAHTDGVNRLAITSRRQDPGLRRGGRLHQGVGPGLDRA